MKRKIVSILLSATMLLGAVSLSACAPTEAEYVIPEVSINADGELIFTFPDGTVKNAGVVKGADGLNGKDGANGINGENGKDGANGKDGKDGANGINGTGIASAEINENGELVITYTDQTTANLGVVKGADGVNGENGKDGANGINGTGIASAEINENGELVITYTNETTANLGVVKGADGKNGANGADGSEITIGECGHWFIDGKDTFYKATEAERDVIKITDETVPFTDETQHKLTIKNVPRTEKKFDINKMIKKSNGDLELQTTDIEEVYAFYDMVCRNEEYPYNGLLMLLNTNNSSLYTTYDIIYRPNRYEFEINIDTYLVIKFEDGREYDVRLRFSNLLDVEYRYGDYIEFSDINSRYVCYDGKAFLEESILDIPAGSLTTGKPDHTYCDLGIDYNTKNESSPYYSRANSDSDIALVWSYWGILSIFIYDTVEYTNKGTLTEEEASLAFGQIANEILGCFEIYDYDYFMHQFDEEIE